MELRNYKEPKPKHIKRIIWYIVNATIYRLLIGLQLRHARTFLLRMFGADMPYSSSAYATVKIWAPWNLKVGKYTCIGDHAEIYNKGIVDIGNNCVISQGAFLCTAGHDITNKYNPLITAPIKIKDKVWVAADAFVGMGVTIGEGAVVGARGCVFKDVEPWNVVGGNPAIFIKKRIIKDE